MSWIFFALLGPLLWSFVNHLDKYVLEKYFQELGVGAFLIFTSLFSISVLPFLLFFNAHILLSFDSILILITTGILNLLWIYLYLEALHRDEASTVVPLLQITPIFSYFFGYLFLHEVIPQDKLFAVFIIICSAMFLSFEFNHERKIHFKKKVFFLMFLCTFCVALSESLFKTVAIHSDFSSSLFWQYIGFIFGGLLLFVLNRNMRFDFISIFKQRSLKKILASSGVAEILTIGGNISVSYATLLAPLVFITTISGFQPIFVFIEGTLLTLLFPQIAHEKIDKHNISKKILGITAICIASYYLVA